MTDKLFINHFSLLKDYHFSLLKVIVERNLYFLDNVLKQNDNEKANREKNLSSCFIFSRESPPRSYIVRL